MPLASHVELPERYRVTRHIASGGMASVWEAEDLLLGRIVAVKVLGAHYAADPRARARFQREARTAARVSDHPHIATIYDIGEHADDAFIVLEHFAGGTVADRLRAGRDGDERVPPSTTLRWLREAAAALDVAHAAGIVHRDVKPANLLLDAKDRLAVCDFGIARLADDTHMTQTGQVLGTAAYLSPEQALGRPATAASDRYALAVVAYELLTGQRPFDDGPPTVQMRQHAEAPPPRASQTAPELPLAIDHVLLRGLAKDPGARPSTAMELVNDIERALTSPKRTVQRTVPLAPLPPQTPVQPVQPVQPQAAAPPSTPQQPVPPQTDAPPSAPQQPIRPQTDTPPSAPQQPIRPQIAAPPSAPQDPPPAAVPEPARAYAASRRSPVIPLLAIAAVLAGGVVALAFTSSGSDDQRTAGRQSSATQPAGDRTQPSTTARAAPAQQQPAETSPATPTATSPATATSTTTTPSASTSASTRSSDPAELNRRGFALNNAGRYGEAVQLLQSSVQGYKDSGNTDGANYYYALYNLGVALNRSGNHQAAVDVLRARLQYANQRATVQRELDDALAQLGGGAKKPSGGAQTPSKPKKTPSRDYDAEG